jgi:short-subunit dehydrogenase
MLARKARSAIVATTSLVAIRPFPGVSAASATKQFQKHLLGCLTYEFESKIDVLTWQCGYVASRMIKDDPKGPLASVPEAVDGMLRDLSYGDRFTLGCLRH